MNNKNKLLTSFISAMSLLTSFNTYAQNNDRVENAQWDMAKVAHGIMPIVRELEGKGFMPATSHNDTELVRNFTDPTYGDANLEKLSLSVRQNYSSNQNIVAEIGKKSELATSEIDVKKAEQKVDSLIQRKSDITRSFGFDVAIIHRDVPNENQNDEAVNKQVHANQDIQYDKDVQSKLTKALGNIDEQIAAAGKSFIFCKYVEKAKASQGEVLSSFDEYMKGKVEGIKKESDRQAMDIVLGSFEKDFREKGFGDIADIVSKNRKYLKIRKLDNSMAKALNEIKKVSGSDSYENLLERQNNLKKHLEDMEKGWGIK